MNPRLALFAFLATTAVSAQQPAYMNPALTPEARAHDLVSRMTIEEKAAQSMNAAPAIPRLNVPAYDYWNEGLHGIARSGYSTLFPQAIGMAATFDAPMLHSIGTVISTEARAKYNDAIAHNNHDIYFGLTVWSPNINIFRDPRWGRGQETYGEDPFLTGTLGLNFITGLQGPDPMHPRTIATPKHYAVHSGPEKLRHVFNVDPSPHDLWDTYLPQFRMAIVDAHADSIMCAYNSIDGKPACASDLLLQDILRTSWHFNGFVTSDCGAVDDIFNRKAHAYVPDKEHAAALALKVGTDTNCGGTYKALPAAIQQGLASEAELNTAVERLFTARFRLGMFDPAKNNHYASLTMSEDRSTAHLMLDRKAAAESMVLLKNDGILPLTPDKYKTIAVIGPNGASLAAIEGNYNAIPKDPAMPVDSLRAALPGAKVLYAQGSSYVDGATNTVPRTFLRPSVDSKDEGLKAEYFTVDADALDKAFNHAPTLTRVDKQIDFDWRAASPVDGLDQSAFAVRWSGAFVPPMAGDYDLGFRLAECYPCGEQVFLDVKIDGKPVLTYGHKFPTRHGAPDRIRIHFADTAPHSIVIEYVHHAPRFGAGLTFDWAPKQAMLEPAAIAAAKAADLVIAMIGLSPELEGEEHRVELPGFDRGDRTDIALPATQRKLLDALAATGKPLVVVALNGSALALNWEQQHANAILEAWYPGEFGGEAIANTLLGKNNPSGRLPITFYHSLDELPAFTDYAMRNRTYRYFTGTPLYAFGYGLSYTHFAYSDLKLSATDLKAGEPLTATVDVKNTGAVAGDEVAELYLVPPKDGNGGLSPKQQLEGFQRVSLAPGEHRRLTFVLEARQLSEVDAQGNRSVQPGAYEITTGGAQPNDPNAPTPSVRARFTITGTAPLAK